VCGVTPETMRQRLSRARALIAARLDEARVRQVSILKEVAS
jgi:DNA-directed RNA polymerase specialized sigma24 family protein